MNLQPDQEITSKKTTPKPPFVRRLVPYIAVAGLLAVAAVGLFVFLQETPRNGLASNGSKDKKHSFQDFGDPLQKWKKPDFVLVLSGQAHGYLQPCGCSSPQFGGYARRFEFIQSLRKRGWAVIPLDLGDLADEPGPQTLLKYQTAMKALKAMNYTAISIGKREFRLPLIEALSHHSLEHKTPAVLTANLQNTGENEVFEPFRIRSHVLATAQNLPRIGIIGLIGNSVISEVKKINDPDVKFAPNSGQVLSQTLKQLKARNAEFNILLYQGSRKSDDEVTAVAKYCQKHHAETPVHVILRLSEASEPSGIPLKIGNTMAVGVGHKGRFVGVVGVFRKGNTYDLKYELVSIAPKYETPVGQEDSNPVMAIMDDYARKVKAGNYIAKFPRHKHWIQNELKNVKVGFAGTRACSGCHSHAHKVWENSGHSHAWQTLKDATRPSLRHFDGECVVCHTVGFKYETGYLDPDNSDRNNKRLLNVGCESCHGPASFHANDPFNKNYYELINPWRKTEEERNPKTPKDRKDFLAKQRMLKIDIFCQSCHDMENDVNWAKVPFEQKWRPVAHPTPANERIGAGPGN